MKIGIDCRMYSNKFTGIGRYTRNLVTHLAEIDQENQYLLYFNKEEFDNFKIPAPNFTKILIDAPHYSLKEQIKFALALYQTRPDLMHFTHFNSPILYFGRQISTIHDLILHFYADEKFNSFTQRIAYKLVFWAAVRKAKKIIVPSVSTGGDLFNFYKFTRNKWQVIYEGVDNHFSNFNPQKNYRMPFRLPRRYLLYTGNWKTHKNLSILISAYQILRRHYKYTGKLVLTGNPESGSPELLEHLEELYRRGLAITPGLIDDHLMPQLYHRADCYVFPSLHEGFGLPILEAFATKTPLIIARTQCLREIAGETNDKPNCPIFSPYDPQELAFRIDRLLRDRPYREQHLTQGSNRLKNFSFRQMAIETHALYLSLLPKRKSKRKTQ